MSTQNEALTIVIPVYNRADAVADTLASVAEQTWRPLHVVLVDNNSTDGTAAVLARWKREVEAPGLRVSVISEPTPGACAARNAGLALADTAWTMFFDSDDIMHSDHVERAMNFIAAHPDAEIVGWPIAVNYVSGKCALKQFIVSDIVYNNIIHSSFATQRYMARTELFRRVGGWRKGLAMADDVELGNRLLATSPKVYKVGDRPTVDAYESEVSISNSPDKLPSLVMAMEAIAENLPQRRRHWADLETIILAANWTREESEAAPVVEPIMARTPLPRRWLWRLFYRWTLSGGRGAGRLYGLIKWTGI